MNSPLSGEDLASSGLRPFVYGELANMDELPEMPFALLYETAPSYGHWVACLETPHGVEHFDSYGLVPDGELDWVPEHLREEFGEAKTHLTRLLLGSGLPVHYNEACLQGPDSSTCGRWCILRCRNSAIPTDAFAQGMLDLSAETGLSPDELVLRMT